MKRVIKHINAANPTPKIFGKVVVTPIIVKPEVIKVEEVKPEPIVEEPIIEEPEIKIEEEPVVEVKKPRKRTPKVVEETPENNEIINNE